MFSKKAILAVALGLSCVVAQAPVSVEQAKVIDGINEFGNELYQVVAKEKLGGNLIMSLFSVHTVLSMAAYGAGNNTSKEMRRSLHLPKPSQIALKGYKEILDSYQNPENVTLNIANKIYAAKGIRLNPNYKSLTSTVFKSNVSILNMMKPDKAAGYINRWAKKNTNNTIQEIVKPEQIGADTRMILINAAYFKGQWAAKFRKESTKKRQFNVDEETQKEVPTMHISGLFRYGMLPNLNASFVELPYTNKNFRMIIFRPDDINGLSGIIGNLKSLNLRTLATEGQNVGIDLYLPKFEIESTTDLEEYLSKLNMREMFSNAANFSFMVKSLEEPLMVGQVRQKAVVEVNEEGSEAAAVTTVSINSRMSSENILVEVDRPFLFMIAMGDIPLFTGHIRNPVQDDERDDDQDDDDISLDED